MARLAVYLFAAAVVLVSCSQTTSLQTAANTATATLKHRVPPADSAKYRSVADARKWQNPHLTAQAKGIDARSMIAVTETPRMSAAEVIDGSPKAIASHAPAR